MRRLLGIAIVGLMAMGLFAAPAPAAAATRAPRVVVIVGPVEGLTDDYRSIGAAAAKEAQRWTSDVVSVVSPNATWPAVKRALQGASIVLYLGHGNGFPSPYRSTLFRPTEDGLGLNPVAGQGDDSHQYFGESFIASQIHLAPHAIVLMSHLCYASGNSEPGMPEPTVAVAQQRVDNFAAGWLAAGADAVVADTFGSPATTIRSLFAPRNGGTTIDRLWAAAPTANDHVQVYASTRTPGAEARIDPSGVASGFDRSLVWRPGLTASQVITATGSIVPLPIVPTSVLPSAPSLASIGVSVGSPDLAPATTDRGLVAGTTATLVVPLSSAKVIGSKTRFDLGIRWQPLDPSPAPATNPPAQTGGPSVTPGPTTSPGQTVPPPGSVPPGPPSPSPTPSPEPSPTQFATPAPPIDPVEAETFGSVVTTVPARIAKGALTITVTLPSDPGRYRLVTTIHDRNGIAYDAASQALLSPLTLRVSAPLSVAYGVTPAIGIVAGSRGVLPIRIANDGSMAWALPQVTPDDVRGAAYRPTPLLVGRWIPLSPDASTLPDTVEETTPVVPPGGQAVVGLEMTAPAEPGAYVLVIDLVSPIHGSLAASGSAPAQVLVTVIPAAPASTSNPEASPSVLPNAAATAPPIAP